MATKVLQYVKGTQGNEYVPKGRFKIINLYHRVMRLWPPKS